MIANMRCYIYACNRESADGRDLNEIPVSAVIPTHIPRTNQNGCRPSCSRWNNGTRRWKSRMFGHQSRRRDGTPCWRNRLGRAVLCPHNLKYWPTCRAESSPAILLSRNGEVWSLLLFHVYRGPKSLG